MMNTTSHVWLQLCMFSETYGLQVLWHSADIDQFVPNVNDRHKILKLFPNFVCTIVIQGTTASEGLHGPFSVRGLLNVTAYVYCFILPSDSKEAGNNSIFLLIIYSNAETAELIDNNAKMRVLYLLKQWSRQLSDAEALNEHEMSDLQEQLNQFIDNEVHHKKRALTVESIKNATRRSLLLLSEHVKNAQAEICITLWSPNHLARLYNVLAFEALQQFNHEGEFSLTDSNYAIAEVNFTHDQMHTLLRTGPLSILAVEQLSALFFLPSQCYIFYLTNSVDIPQFLKEIAKNVAWEDVTRAFFLLHDLSPTKRRKMSEFCDVLTKYYPNIKKAIVINVSWIKEGQITTLLHVFNDLIVESVLELANS